MRESGRFFSEIAASRAVSEEMYQRYVCSSDPFTQYRPALKRELVSTDYPAGRQHARARSHRPDPDEVLPRHPNSPLP